MLFCGIDLNQKQILSQTLLTATEIKHLGEITDLLAKKIIRIHTEMSSKLIQYSKINMNGIKRKLTKSEILSNEFGLSIVEDPNIESLCMELLGYDLKDGFDFSQSDLSTLHRFRHEEKLFISKQLQNIYNMKQMLIKYPELSIICELYRKEIPLWMELNISEADVMTYFKIKNLIKASVDLDSYVEYQIEQCNEGKMYYETNSLPEPSYITPMEINEKDLEIYINSFLDDVISNLLDRVLDYKIKEQLYTVFKRVNTIKNNNTIFEKLLDKVIDEEYLVVIENCPKIMELNSILNIYRKLPLISRDHSTSSSPLIQNTYESMTASDSMYEDYDSIITKYADSFIFLQLLDILELISLMGYNENLSIIIFENKIKSKYNIDFYIQEWIKTNSKYKDIEAEEINKRDIVGEQVKIASIFTSILRNNNEEHGNNN